MEIFLQVENSFLQGNKMIDGSANSSEETFQSLYKGKTEVNLEN